MNAKRILAVAAVTVAGLGMAAGGAQAHGKGGGHADTVVGVNGPLVNGDVIDVDDSLKGIANDWTIGVDGPITDAVKVLTHG